MLLERPATCVIFDLDGVLLDTEPLYTRATEAIVSRYGKRFDWEIKLQTMGRDPSFGAELLVRTLELPITAAEYLSERTLLLEGLLPAAKPIPGAQLFVETLVAGEIPIAVATSSDRRMFGIKTQHHDWFRNFSVVVCGDDGTARYKPAPDIFLATAERLGQEPENCLVFEDSIAGLAAALSANMQVIALPDERQRPEHFAGAQHRARDFRELIPNALGLFQAPSRDKLPRRR